MMELQGGAFEGTCIQADAHSSGRVHLLSRNARPAKLDGRRAVLVDLAVDGDLACEHLHEVVHLPRLVAWIGDGLERLPRLDRRKEEPTRALLLHWDAVVRPAAQPSLRMERSLDTPSQKRKIQTTLGAQCL
jgi:hypothetical protein